MNKFIIRAVCTTVITVLALEVLARAIDNRPKKVRKDAHDLIQDRVRDMNEQRTYDIMFRGIVKHNNL